MLSKKRAYLRAALAVGLVALLIPLIGCDVLFNKPPVAVIKAAPTSSGSAPVEVLLDGSSSYDPDGEILKYSWSFGDGSTGTGKIVSHIYESQGVFTASLKVTDNNGASNSATIIINIGGGEDTVSFKAKIDLPAGSPINVSQLKAISILDESDVSQDGSVSISGFTAPTQTVIVENQRGKIVLLGYLFLGQAVATMPAALQHYIISPFNEIKLNAQSTALALIMLHPILISSPAHGRVLFAEQAIKNIQFQNLVNLVEKALISNPEDPLDFSTQRPLYELASQISLEVFESGLGSSATIIQPERIPLPRVYPDNRPWIEDAPGKYVSLVNGSSIYYAAEALEYDTKRPRNDIFILDKIDWIFVVPGPAKEAQYYIGRDRITFRIDKGGGLLDPDRLSDPLVQWATLLNGGAAALYALQLVVSIPVGPTILKDFVTAAQKVQLLTKIAKVLEAKDIFGAISAAIELFGDEGFRKVVFDLLADILRDKIKNAVELLKKAGEIIKNLTKVLTLPEKAVFFWDLLFAPSEAIYNVEEPKQLTYIPTVSITEISRTSVEAPSTVSFSCYAADIDGRIVKYKWNFGDGNSGHGESTYHTYQDAGTFLVTVTMEDDDGSWATDTVTITVNPGNRPPTATILSPSNNSTFTQGDTITFRGQATDPEDGRLSGSSLVWTSSRDGMIGTGESFTKSDLSVGTHTITLTATDSKGAIGQDNISITINKRPNQSPVAIIKASPTSGNAPLTVYFDGTSSYDPDGNIVSYNWSFGDGATGSGARLNHTYSSAGTYTATLTVTDNERATGTDSITINVSQLAKISTSLTITLDPSSIPENTDRTIKVSGRLARKDTGQGIANKEIDILFSDWPKTAFTDSNGYYQTEYSVNLHSGSYEFSASFAGDREYEGSEATAILIVTPIANKPPVAVIKASPTSGNAPLIVNFDGSDSYDPDGSIITYHWDFGDGSIDIGVRVLSHTYNNPGTYTAVLTVTDDKGATATAHTTINVTPRPANRPPVACFSFEPSSPKVGETIVFDASCSYDPDGSIVEYLWYFPDGTRQGQQTRYSFEAAGTYHICLQITDNQGDSDRTCRDITVKAVGGSFTGWEFTCAAVTGYSYECTLSYNNQLGENAIIVFFFRDVRGGIINAPSFTVPQGSGTVKASFYCGGPTEPGWYYVDWGAYRESDTALSNPVAGSRREETQSIVCPIP